MDIVNNQQDFEVALHLLCEFIYAYNGLDSSRCALHCPLATDGTCHTFFDMNDYSLDRRREIANLYASIGLPVYANEALLLAGTLNRANSAIAQWIDAHKTEWNPEITAANDTESPVMPEETPVINARCHDEVEVIRITRDKRCRPVLYVNGERVRYGRSFVVDGNVDCELTYDVMGVPV